MSEYEHHHRSDGRLKPSERIRLAAHVRELTKQGLSVAQIAERLRISRHLIDRFRRKSRA
jgi:DNA-binding CsgD family transcriptional regulator